MLSQNDLDRNKYVARRRQSCQRLNSSASRPNKPKNVYRIVSKSISTQTLPMTEEKSVNTKIHEIDAYVPEIMTPSFGPNSGNFQLNCLGMFLN